MRRVLKLRINFVNLLLFLVSAVFVLPRLINPVFAQTNTAVPTCVQTELGCIPTDAPGFVSSFYGIGLGLIGGVSLLFLIYGGYNIMISQGNPDKLKIGKSFIYYAIAGLILAIFGFVFVQIIAVDILAVPGIK